MAMRQTNKRMPANTHTHKSAEDIKKRELEHGRKAKRMRNEWSWNTTPRENSISKDILLRNLLLGTTFKKYTIDFLNT